MNIVLAQKLILELESFGLTEFVVCPGGRNSPIVKVLGAQERLAVTYYFEERSAAFFALGRARRSGKPVAVVTTSGTAVANLLPAMIEAKYSGVPLVAISADRPESYRGTGAPQAMNQIGIFGEHAAGCFNWSVRHQDLIQLHLDHPAHINIEFDEPLVDSEQIDLPAPYKNLRELMAFVQAKDFSIWNASAFENIQRPFFIISHLPDESVNLVRAELKRLNAVFYAEGPSGLFAEPGNIHFVPKKLTEHFDSVIRIGGIPTHRVWRDLEASLREVPVFNFSPLPFSGHARFSETYPLDHLVKLSSLKKWTTSGWQAEIETSCLEKTLKVEKNPASELAWVQKISNFIPDGSMVFLGNSLAVREWDEIAIPKAHKIRVNRGMNGIDGLIATFLGIADESQENWLVLGDLSALYDLPSLHLRDQLTNCNLRVVIINNGGGKIFAPMFKDKHFENRHQLNFEGIARTFGWSYLQGSQWNEHTKMGRHTIIEVTPEANT